MPALGSLIPPWVLGAVIMIGTMLVVLAMYRWLAHSLIRLAGKRSAFLQQLLRRGQGPASAFVVIFALGVALPAARFPLAITLMIANALLILFILTIGWGAAIAMDIAITLYLRRFRTDVDDHLLARKHVTQMRLLQRVATILLGIVTVAAALMTLPAVRQYGVSLFASAGAAGLVLGLAARPVLSNLLAGIQIAMTQPIRVEDVVIVEGEWGWIETITSTYVVVRLWDLRRMIVPLSYFIEKPFQNWTYQSSDLIGSVFLRVDYTVPIDRLRAKLERVVQANPQWDRKVVVLQVTDTPDSFVELRALVSARNSGDLWDLRCAVREQLIAFLQAEYPQALPRQRVEMAGSPAREVAAGDAHRDHDMAHAAALTFDQRVSDHARARHAVGMADRNRTAIDIVTLGVDAEPVAAIKRLHGKRLVQFPQTDVVDREPVLRQQFGDGKHRADPHLVRVAAGNRDAAIGAERLETAAFSRFGLDQQCGRGAVGQLRGVAGGDKAALLDPLTVAKNRLQRRQRRQGRGGAVALVLVEPYRHQRGLAGLAVVDPHCRGERRDLAVKPAGGLGRCGALLRGERVLVLRLAGHLIALGDDLGGFDHRHIEVGPVLDQPRVLGAVFVALVVLDQ